MSDGNVLNLNCYSGHISMYILKISLFHMQIMSKLIYMCTHIYIICMYIYTHTHAPTNKYIHKILDKVENMKYLTKLRMNIIAYSYNKILYCSKNEQTITTGKNMNDSQS